MKELPPIAATYLKFIFRPEYHEKLERTTESDMIQRLKELGIISEGIVHLTDQQWKEILHGK